MVVNSARLMQADSTEKKVWSEPFIGLVGGVILSVG
jgi:hypothetical protein